jgi:hypothetical protein
VADCLKLVNEISGAAFLVDASLVEVQTAVDQANVSVLTAAAASSPSTPLMQGCPSRTTRTGAWP